MSNLQQGSNEWLEYRRSKIGASDLPIIVGVCPKSWKQSTYKLWEIKTGRREPDPITPAMQRGINLEPIARAKAQERFKLELFPKVLEHNEMNWAIASLDAFSEDETLLIEIKCLSETNHVDIVETKKAPEHYNIQCQWQLFVTGLQCMYLMSYLDGDYELIEIKRDDSLIEELVKKAYEFYLCVVNDTPPQISEKDTIFIETSIPEDFKEKARNADLQLKKWKKEWDMLRQQILDLGDDGNCESDFFKISITSPTETIDVKKLARDLSLSDELLSKYKKYGASSARVTIKHAS